MSEEDQNPTPSQPPETSLPKKSRRRKAKKKKPTKSQRPRASTSEGSKTRLIRSFPASTFQDALILAEAFQKYAAGQTRVRKLTLFDKIGKSPDSGPSRQLITNSSRYGLTKGGTKPTSSNLLLREI